MFIIYTEPLLRRIEPELPKYSTKAGMFADDLTLWATGNDTQSTSGLISGILNDTALPWLRQNNMSLSTSKCHSFLLSTHRKEVWPNISLMGQTLSPPKDPKKLRIIGVFLDRQLTMSHHLKAVLGKCNR